MKLLFCMICNDFVAPRRRPFAPASCMCGRHTIWFTDPDNDNAGRRMVVLDAKGQNSRASILRLQIRFTDPLGDSTAEEIAELIAASDQRFRDQNSLIIRSSIDNAPDVFWDRGEPENRAPR
jgi:hypothetical protein